MATDCKKNLNGFLRDFMNNACLSSPHLNWSAKNKQYVKTADKLLSYLIYGLYLLKKNLSYLEISGMTAGRISACIYTSPPPIYTKKHMYNSSLNISNNAITQ